MQPSCAAADDLPQPPPLRPPVHRLGHPAEILDGDVLQGGRRGEVGDPGLDVRGEAGQGEEPANAHPGAVVAARGVAEGPPFPVDLRLDVQRQGEFVGDARGLRTDRRRPSDAQSAAL